MNYYYMRLFCTSWLCRMVVILLLNKKWIIWHIEISYCYIPEQV
jgi:hypothetical protein